MQIPKQDNQKPVDSFQKYWENYRREWERWFQRTAEILQRIFPDSTDVILSSQVFKRHEPRVNETKAGTAVTVTRKAGQDIINVVANDLQIIEAVKVLSQHPARIDELKAGTNITITRKAGQVTITTTAYDDANEIIAGKVYGF